VTVSDCETGAVLRTFPALFAFAKGGTVTNTTAGQFPALFTPGFGVWQHKEGHTYSAVSEAFVFSPTGAWIQTHRLTRVITVDGDEFTDKIDLEIFDTSGNLIVRLRQQPRDSLQMSAEKLARARPMKIPEGAPWFAPFSSGGSK
jgi:hypothetical protein